MDCESIHCNLTLNCCTNFKFCLFFDYQSLQRCLKAVSSKTAIHEEIFAFGGQSICLYVCVSIYLSLHLSTYFDSDGKEECFLLVRTVVVESLYSIFLIERHSPVFPSAPTVNQTSSPSKKAMVYPEKMWFK